ncbi:hypothetical protein BU16DRAFT_556465 [Lophium mytilinum]|uniref:BTB domain-containing protein n=1 Tax=Lophium mytilinum TaxID=390894 RepID=A0A6A6R8A1_9PEZI|nr:hypothetical protein BU16DRAFT_556465 [Lophium mytilinum]
METPLDPGTTPFIPSDQEHSSPFFGSAKSALSLPASTQEVMDETVELSGLDKKRKRPASCEGIELSSHVSMKRGRSGRSGRSSSSTCFEVVEPIEGQDGMGINPNSQAEAAAVQKQLEIETGLPPGNKTLTPEDERDDKSTETSDDESTETRDDESTESEEESTTSYEPQPDLSIVIDLAGDRKLIIRGHADLQALISTPCVRRISNFWKSLLDTDVTEPVVEEFDSKSVLILLDIAHGNMRYVPEHMEDPAMLLKIAFLCVNYGGIEHIRPFLRGWAWPIISSTMKPDNEEWLFISWVFGYNDTFEAATRRIALTANSDEDIFSIDGNPLAADSAFEDAEKGVYRIILDNVSRVRSGIINEILDVCHKYVEVLSKPGRTRCKLTSGSTVCESLALGCLVKGLTALKLWPRRPDPKKLIISVHNLILKLRTVLLIGNGSHTEKCDHNTDFHEALALCLSSDDALLEQKGLWFPTTGFKALEDEHEKHFESFRLRTSEVDPLIWKSKALMDMGFVERDEIGLIYKPQDDGTTLVICPEENFVYDSDCDESNWSDDNSVIDLKLISQPDEEYLAPGYESGWDSDAPMNDDAD